MSTTNFYASLQEIFSRLEKTVWKEKAWEHFLKVGLPGRDDDAFKYVPLKRLYDMKLSLSASHTDVPLPDAPYSIVFVNGRYSSKLSKLPPRMTVLPLQEALKTYATFLPARLNVIKGEKDPFAILNLALEEGGVFCHVPPEVKVPHPVQILFYAHGETTYAAARMHVYCAAQSELNLIQSVIGNGVHHIAMDVALEEGAHLSVVEHASGGILLNDFRATQKSSSTLKHFTLTKAGILTRHRLHVSLLGERADALLQGLWNLERSDQCHTHAFVEHVAPHCTSLQKFKGVLKNTAQSSFEGKIYVHPEAQKTQAYQVNHNLLLGEGAVANAKPNLEIFADDVKASHGATMSEVDDEQLFYLQSRGISRDDARALLIRGFIQEMLDQIPHKSLRDAF